MYEVEKEVMGVHNAQAYGKGQAIPLIPTPGCQRSCHWSHVQTQTQTQPAFPAQRASTRVQAEP